MRFDRSGPVIPDVLVRQQELGQVVFVCGAGVSITAGLPSFRALVEGVYSHLNEDWRLHHAENEVMREGGLLEGQYDRALRSLERRLEAHDVRQTSGLRRRIRDAVNAQLAPAVGADLTNHLALLDLSRGPDNASRLLTTNFDPLFELAWHGERGSSLPSHAGAAMPRQGTAAFEGVLHLHGRSPLPTIGLGETDLILTSAEFGEAYLRSGWATRYVYDLARAFTLVLVGYQADDPPMRYLLEALEDDRTRYPDLKQVYAFAPAKADEEDLQRALWLAKGVEPIIYRYDDSADHGCLYASLRAWREYAVEPGAWRESRLREIFSTPFDENRTMQAEEAGMLLSRDDAPDLLAKLSPDPTWWRPLSMHGLAARPEASGAWIAARLDDPAMLRACVDDQPAEPKTYNRPLALLDHAESAARPHLAQGWRLLARSSLSRRRASATAGWYGALGRIRSRAIGYDERLAAVDAVRPRLKVIAAFDWGPTSLGNDGDGVELRSLMRIEFDTAGDPSSREVIDTWPEDVAEQAALFKIADRVLAEVLDEASAAGYLDGLDRASTDVGSIARPGHSMYEHGFAPLVNLLAGLWNRIAAGAPDLARSLASRWAAEKHLLHRRLYLHAISRQGVFPNDEACAALAGLDDDLFWKSETEREVADAIASRLNGNAGRLWDALLARILAGPPLRLFRQDPSTDEAAMQAVVDWLVFRRIEPIRRAGHELPPGAMTALDALIARYPENYLTLPEDEATGSRRKPVQQPSEPQTLVGVADDSLVAAALRFKEAEDLAGSGAWAALCRMDPMHAIRGVRAAPLESACPEILGPLLAAAYENDLPEFQEGLADLLVQLPPQALTKNIAASAAGWVWERAKKAGHSTSMPPSMLRAWDAVASAVLDVDEPRATPSTEVTVETALKSRGGLLALGLLTWVGLVEWPKAKGFGPEYAPRLDRLASTLGPEGLHARILLVRHLAYLYRVDPGWAELAVVPRLEWTDPEALSLWSARAGNQIGPAPLFNALKPAMLESLLRPGGARRRSEMLARDLLQVARWKQDPAAVDYDLTWSEARSALSRTSTQVRKSASWLLWRWVEDGAETAAIRAERWHSWVGPLFEKVWPLDAAAQDAESSRNLVLMALACGDSFPDAVDAVSDFVVPFPIIRIENWLLLNIEHHTAINRHPGAFLRLLDRAIGPAPELVPSDLNTILESCMISNQTVRFSVPFARLNGLRRR